MLNDLRRNGNVDLAGKCRGGVFCEGMGVVTAAAQVFMIHCRGFNRHEPLCDPADMIEKAAAGAANVGHSLAAQRRRP